MKPEEQRIAIAEACGWHNLHNGLGVLTGTKLAGPVNDTANPIYGIPDYLNDLNAIADAEKRIYGEFGDSDLISIYEGRIRRLSYYPIRATAAQRAMAFLKTIGKWKD